MMKHAKEKSDQYPGIEIKGKNCDSRVYHTEDHFEYLNFYRFAYSYPFIPMVDLTLVFDELGKMIKYRLFKRRENTNIYKNKINDTL